MVTSFSEIYDLFSSTMSDYSFLQLEEEDQDDILEGWLLNAIAEFDNCAEDLDDRDDELKQFNNVLSDRVKKILVKGMLVEWMNPRLYDLENLRNHLNTKDFSIYSPANLLKEIRDTHNKIYKEFNADKIRYGYINFYKELNDRS